MVEYRRIVRASRLVQLLLVLQRRGKVTAADLAAELEVSVRTIYRDVEALGMAGVPVVTDSGPGGGVSLIGGYETRLTGLTGDEATAIGLAGVPTAAAELGLGSVLVAAQAKVDAALPPELRARAVRVRERFHVDAPGWFQRPTSVPMLPALSSAVWDGRAVELHYAGRNGTVRRRVDPLGLVLKGANWYLVAGSRRPERLRSFRVDRVRAVRSMDRAVERPESFDLATAWGELQAGFEQTLRSFDVVVRMARADVPRLRHALPEPSASRALDAAAAAEGDPVTFVAQSESVEVAHGELLRLGGRVEVLAPPAVREAMRATGAAIAAAHATLR